MSKIENAKNKLSSAAAREIFDRCIVIAGDLNKFELDPNFKSKSFLESIALASDLYSDESIGDLPVDDIDDAMLGLTVFHCLLEASGRREEAANFRRQIDEVLEQKKDLVGNVQFNFDGGPLKCFH